MVDLDKAKADAISEMMALQGPGDTEDQHEQADRILCDFLEILGHDELVQEYYLVNKGYS